MEEILSVIFEVVIIAILVYPGAFIRWIISGGKNKKPFKTLVKDRPYLNGSIGVIFIVIVCLSVGWIM